MEQKQIVVQNLILNYYALESKKEKGGKVLVFLHGWRSDSTVWFETMEIMAELGYHSIALDLPGFGKSQTPDQVFNTDKYADLVVEFLNKLKLEKSICIGHSYGGRVLIDIGVNNKADLEKIILVDASGVGIKEGEMNLKKTLAKIIKPLFKPKFMQGLRKKIYQSIGAEDYIVAEDSPFFKETYQNILRDQYNELLAKIKTPLFMIWGEEDQDTPLVMAVEIQHATHGKLVAMEKAGHFPFIDQPEEFVKILDSFLTE
ncbi:MAG: alpha/beta hydrolase [Candidatus Dojkabacteria bacterium]